MADQFHTHRRSRKLLMVTATAAAMTLALTLMPIAAVAASPKPPRSLTVRQTALGEVTLQWRAPRGTAVVLDYQLVMSAGKGPWTTIDDGTGVNTTFTIGGLASGVRHRFRVVAVTDIGTSKPSSAKTVTPKAPSFRRGTRQVGRNVEPGRYVAPGSSFCYWARLSGFGGDLGDIIANGIVIRGQVIVDIQPTDVGFKSSGCGTWTLYTGASKVVSFQRGVWLVGSQVEPGRWQAPGGDSCYWARLSGFTGDLGSIIANDFMLDDGPVIVDILPTDVGFESSLDCGTWTRTA
jgi:hypothetical protein